MKIKAKAYSTQEVAHYLRLALGSSFSWVKVLESMRNDGYSISGIDLQPCTKLPGRIPVYASHDIVGFVRKMKSKFAHLGAKEPIQSVTVEYDASLPWQFQRSEPIKARLVRGVKAAVIGVGLSAMCAAYAHAGKADESKVTYVGDGRYTCQGNSSQCAQVEAANRQREQQRQYDNDRQRYEAGRYIQEQPRREQENKSRY
jgi:hypothetical protein